MGSFRVLCVVQNGFIDGVQSEPFEVVFDFVAQDDGELMFKGGNVRPWRRLMATRGQDLCNGQTGTQSYVVLFDCEK